MKLDELVEAAKQVAVGAFELKIGNKGDTSNGEQDKLKEIADLAEGVVDKLEAFKRGKANRAELKAKQ